MSTQRLIGFSKKITLMRTKRRFEGCPLVMHFCRRPYCPQDFLFNNIHHFCLYTKLDSTPQSKEPIDTCKAKSIFTQPPFLSIYLLLPFSCHSLSLLVVKKDENKPSVFCLITFSLISLFGHKQLHVALLPFRCPIFFAAGQLPWLPGLPHSRCFHVCHKIQLQT